MPSIGHGCHELRIRDTESRVIWRIFYRVDPDVILVVDVFAKKTQKTPLDAINRFKARLANYDRDWRSES
jgi:phage-related protein